MMNVISNNIFRIHKIHVVDIGKNNILESTYYEFDTSEEMFQKWQELLNEDHHHMDFISQDVHVATAIQGYDP